MNIVAHNLQSMNANRQLGIVTNNRTKSTEKLASGYKINRAADDAAGLAISEKMRKQIRGLTQGTDNAQDGVSMCQIADGALAEVGDMLHRITELSVKSANGTNSRSDREAIQMEVGQILTEIDRISTTTKFNETNIFGIGRRPSTEAAETELSNAEIMDMLFNDKYPKIRNPVKLDDIGESISSEEANVILYNLSNYTIFDKILVENYDYPADIDEIEPLYWKLHNKVKQFSLNSKEEHDKAANDAYPPVDLELRWQETEAYMRKGFEKKTREYFYNSLITGSGYGINKFAPTASGYILRKTAEWLAVGKAGSDLSNLNVVVGGGSIHGCMGQTEAILRRFDNNCELNLLNKKLWYKNSWLSAWTTKEDAICDIYRYLFRNEPAYSDEEGFRGVWIQSGSDVADGIYLNFDAMDTEVLGIRTLDVSTQEGALDALERTKPALRILSDIRSKIGAQQNRLEHTIRHQENTIENTQQSESRIRDTDMAEEMVRYAKEGILQQAGQMVLAQANQSNQGVLSLL